MWLQCGVEITGALPGRFGLLIASMSAHECNVTDLVGSHINFGTLIWSAPVDVSVQKVCSCLTGSAAPRHPPLLKIGRHKASDVCDDGVFRILEPCCLDHSFPCTVSMLTLRSNQVHCQQLAMTVDQNHSLCGNPAVQWSHHWTATLFHMA